MNEQKYLEKFDKTLRNHLRPFLLSVIRQISEANLEVFDLVNEYCEDNEFKYVGEKPRRKNGDKVILNTLSLDEEWTKKKIQDIAKEPKPSQARSALTEELLKGMDVQAAMRLLVFRWFDVAAVDGANIGKISKTLGVERNVIAAVKSALNVLISDRNKGIAHFSANSKMDEVEFKQKMSRVTFVFEQIGFLDKQLCEEYEQARANDDEKIEEKESKKLDKKWIFLGIGVVCFILIAICGIKIVDDINTLENDTVFVQSEELEVTQEKKLQIYPSKIYCENDQLLIELWIGNGTDKPMEAANISILLENSAGKKMVQLEDFRYQFPKTIDSGESTIIKIHFEAHQVSHKSSDLSKILWGAEGYAE